MDENGLKDNLKSSKSHRNKKSIPRKVWNIKLGMMIQNDFLFYIFKSYFA